MKCVFFQRCVWGCLVEGLITASYQIGGWQELPKLSVCVCVYILHRRFFGNCVGKGDHDHQYHFQSSWTFGSRCCHRKPIAEVSSKDMVQRIDRLQIFSRWDRQEVNICLLMSVNTMQFDMLMARLHCRSALLYEINWIIVKLEEATSNQRFEHCLFYLVHERTLQWCLRYFGLHMSRIPILQRSGLPTWTMSLSAAWSIALWMHV